MGKIFRSVIILALAVVALLFLMRNLGDKLPISGGFRVLTLEPVDRLVARNERLKIIFSHDLHPETPLQALIKIRNEARQELSYDHERARNVVDLFPLAAESWPAGETLSIEISPGIAVPFRDIDENELTKPYHQDIVIGHSFLDYGQLLLLDIPRQNSLSHVAIGAVLEFNASLAIDPESLAAGALSLIAIYGDESENLGSPESWLSKDGKTIFIRPWSSTTAFKASTRHRLVIHKDRLRARTGRALERNVDVHLVSAANRDFESHFDLSFARSDLPVEGNEALRGEDELLRPQLAPISSVEIGNPATNDIVPDDLRFWSRAASRLQMRISAHRLGDQAGLITGISCFMRLSPMAEEDIVQRLETTARLNPWPQIVPCDLVFPRITIRCSEVVDLETEGLHFIFSQNLPKRSFETVPRLSLQGEFAFAKKAWERGQHGYWVKLMFEKPFAYSGSGHDLILDLTNEIGSFPLDGSPFAEEFKFLTWAADLLPVVNRKVVARSGDAVDDDRGIGSSAVFATKIHIQRYLDVVSAWHVAEIENPEYFLIPSAIIWSPKAWKTRTFDSSFRGKLLTVACRIGPSWNILPVTLRFEPSSGSLLSGVSAWVQIQGSKDCAFATDRNIELPVLRKGTSLMKSLILVFTLLTMSTLGLQAQKLDDSPIPLPTLKKNYVAVDKVDRSGMRLPAATVATVDGAVLTQADLLWVLLESNLATIASTLLDYKMLDMELNRAQIQISDAEITAELDQIVPRIAPGKSAADLVADGVFTVDYLNRTAKTTRGWKKLMWKAKNIPEDRRTDQANMLLLKLYKGEITSRYQLMIRGRRPEPPTGSLAALSTLIRGKKHTYSVSPYEAMTFLMGVLRPQSILQAQSQLVNDYLVTRALAAANTVVTDSEVEGYVREMRAKFQPPFSWEMVLQAKGLTPDQDRVRWRNVQAWLRSTGTEITVDKMQRFCKEHEDYFRSRYVEVKHILIKTIDGGTGTSMGESAEKVALAKATKIKELIEEGRDFNELARHFSDDSTNAKNGGKLAQPVKKWGGNYDKNFQKAAYSLEKKDQIIGPIKSIYGYHIIKALAVSPPTNRNIDFTDARYTEWIRDEYESIKMKEWLIGMREAAKVVLTPPKELFNVKNLKIEKLDTKQ